MIKIIIIVAIAITVYSADLSDYRDLFELRRQLADYKTLTARPQSADYVDAPRGRSRPNEYVEFIPQRPQPAEYVEAPLVVERPTPSDTAPQQYTPVAAPAAQSPYYTAPLAAPAYTAPLAAPAYPAPAYAAPTELVQPIAGPIGAAQAVKYFSEWAGVGANIKTNEAPVDSQAAFNVMNFANLSIFFAARPAPPPAPYPLPYYK